MLGKCIAFSPSLLVPQPVLDTYVVPFAHIGMTQTEYDAAADAGSLTTTHSQFVTAMLEHAPEDADQLYSMVMQRLNFSSSYAFGKYLTELMVEEFPLPRCVSKAMVRPSLISSIAGAPYPG